MSEQITIARPYAQAVFELAREGDALAAWSDRLAFLAAVTADPQMAALVESPEVSDERLIGLYLDIGGERLDETAGNFLRLLAENKRLALLPEIAGVYERLRSEAEGAVQAEVVSAYPVTDAQREKIAAALSRRLGRDVQLECRTDPSVIGGAVVRAGDLVIDGSVRGRLERLSAALSH